MRLVCCCCDSPDLSRHIDAATIIQACADTFRTIEAFRVANESQTPRNLWVNRSRLNKTTM